MKNTTLFLIHLLLIVGLQAQTHISNAFEIENEWILSKNVSQYQQKGLVGCVANNQLYCCHRRGFQDKDNQYQAVVNVIDMATGAERTCTLPLPEKNVNATTAKQYWIRNMQVVDNQLLIFTHDAILIYQERANQTYKLLQKVVCDMPETTTKYQKDFCYIEKVPELGRFVLKSQTSTSNSESIITNFSLYGAFMVHYEPNGFIKIADSTIYFLNSPKLSIQQYSLRNGKSIQIVPKLNHWHPLPDSLVQKINAMPYGSERAMYTFYQLKEYSFPLEIFPLCDTILLLTYHTYNKLEDKEEIQSAKIRHDGKGNVQDVMNYSHYFSHSQTITDSEFPLYYAQNQLRLNVADNDRLIQIVREAPVPWRGKTGQTYLEETEQYFAINTPQFRLRIAKLKNSPLTNTPNINYLTNYQNHRFTRDSLPAKKAIFVLNNPPQCHDCEENLYTFLNSIDTATINLYVVFNNADSYLVKQDLLDNVQQHLSLPFTPLYVPTSQKKQFLNHIQQDTFPLLILFDGTTFTTIPNEQIFSTNSSSSALNDQFNYLIQQFSQQSHDTDSEK